jgi:tetratricopeptide (TPR) repeat protein
MQRYRVNYKLLVSIFVGSVVLAVTLFFLRNWQVSRKAGYYRANAQTAKDEGKLEEAFETLLKYVQLRRDEDEPRIELAHIGLELLKKPNVPNELKSQAYGALEEAVRKTGDPELRLESAKLALQMLGRPQDALVHLDELLSANPDDEELLILQAQATYRVKGVKPAIKLAYELIGYDVNEDKFDTTKAKAKDNPQAYSMAVGFILEEDEDNKALAKRVADQLVEVNPDSADAYLYQSIALQILDEKDAAAEALAKAYELDPTNVDVLQKKGEQALLDKNYEEAENVFTEAIEKSPDRIGLYDLLSRTLMMQNKLDEALKVLDDGIAQVGEERALMFSRDKINIYLQQENYDAVEKETEKIRKVGNPALDPFIDFCKARIVWQKQQWSEAARQLSALRPKLIDLPTEQAMAGALLGAAYERQGKNDLAMQVYAEVVEKFPEYEAAKAGLENLRSRVGITKDDEANDLDNAINAMAALPENEQDWAKIDNLVKQIAAEREFSEARLKLVEANVMMKRKKYAEAKELIRAAAKLEPDNTAINYAAIGLLNSDPDSGAEAALQALESMEKRFGDNRQSRVIKAQLYRSIGGAAVVGQIESLVDGIDEWSDADKAELYASISAQFEVLQNYQKAREYLLKAMELVPDSLPIRTRLFEIAFQERNDEKMREAEQLILDLVEDKNDGNYIYAQVRHMMLDYTEQRIDREVLLSARELLDGVLERRPQWHEAHVLYGQLLLLLEVDQDIALKHLEDALKYGAPNANAVALQVKLLGQRGQMAEAREKMRLIPENLHLQLLGRAAAEVLLLNGEKDSAMRMAAELAKLESQNPSTQVWFARIANETGDTKSAIAALEAATKLAPTDADIWMQLLAIHSALKDNEAIEDTLRQAQLSIEGDFMTLLLARKFELMGDWRSAEKMYLANFAGRLEEPQIAQRMAEFYLLWAQAGKTTNDQAAPYINTILRLANEGKLDRNSPYTLWARDKAARLLSMTGDYQLSKKAQKLLGVNGDLTNVPIQEKALLAEILASRNEPQAQLKAISMLSDMDRNRTITRDGVLALARLLSMSGDWDRSRELMVNAIEKFPTDEQVRSNFINLLIERKDYVAASKQLEGLKALNPTSSGYISLSLKLAAESGNKAKVVSTLKSMIPENLSGALTDQQLESILMVARLATEHGEYQLAGDLYDLYVYRKPDAISLEYARYKALHGDPDKAMVVLNSLFPQSMDDILRIAAEMLRTRRAEFGDKYDAAVNELIAASLRDDPESVQRMLIKAEILEIQAQYEASVAQYDQVLQRDDVPRLMRAAAMNNLGFLLTLMNERTDEAQEFINQAIEVYGPVDDILDTRAVVYMTRKEYEKAVEDMSLATALSNDPVKFYHSAQANLLAGNDQAALKAWEKAQQLGFTKEKLPVLEQKNFDQVKSDIEGLRTQNAGL